MRGNRVFAAVKGVLFLFLLFSFLVGFSASASFINDGVFDSLESTGRNLLQAKRSCPLNFEFMNYTVITSKCKGPQYPPKMCCEAFKEFACPYADDINDGTNDCATTMFSYINLFGKYPPGLFASECREGKMGLQCSSNSTSASNDTASASCAHRWMQHISPIPVFMYGFVIIVMFS